MMRFVIQTPSLQHIAQVKITATLLNQDDVLTKITQAFYELPFYDFYTAEGRKKWTVIEDQVKNKVWALPLPGLCKKELMNFVKLLGNEITVWGRSYEVEKDHYKFVEIALRHKLLRWTMHGTVDYAKTAELMVKDEKVDVEQRYKVACLHCLEDAARKLFQFIPEERRRKYFHRDILITYFTCLVTGQTLEKHLADSYHFMGPAYRGEFINKYLFNLTLFRGTRGTSEYFFEKLNPEEKEQVLLEFQMYRHNQLATGKLLYYLSLMNEEQQRRMFEKYTVDVLKRLLRWPLQSLFMEAAECGWSNMDKYQCSHVLHVIGDKIRDGFEDYDYRQLFRECWRLSREECKQAFLFDRAYLVSLIKTKEEEFIKFVFNEAPWYCLKKLAENSYGEISSALLDESVISEAALMECKDAAALESLKFKKDRGKRLRCQYLGRLIATVMENRIKSRE